MKNMIVIPGHDTHLMMMNFDYRFMCDETSGMIEDCW